MKIDFSCVAAVKLSRKITVRKLRTADCAIPREEETEQSHARTLNEYEQEEEVPCKVRIQFFASSRNRSRRGDSSRREKEPAAGPVCVFL